MADSILISGAMPSMHFIFHHLCKERGRYSPCVCRIPQFHSSLLPRLTCLSNLPRLRHTKSAERKGSLFFPVLNTGASNPICGFIRLDSFSLIYQVVFTPCTLVALHPATLQRSIESQLLDSVSAHRTKV